MKRKTLTEENCILIDIFALAGSSMEIWSLWEYYMLDGDVAWPLPQWRSAGGQHSSEIYLNVVDNEVSSAE